MDKSKGWIMGILLVICMATSSQAAFVFQDNFNTENGGNGSLNYNNFTNWNVTDGTVDLIGNGFYDYYSGHGNGLYVDLDGSTFKAGIMSTKTIFAPGTYTLQFDLGGNQIGYPPDVVDISLGSWNTSLTRYSADPLATVTYTFFTTGGALVFYNSNGGDNTGPLLDNVKLSAVPLPASVLLLAPGLLGLVGLRRKLKG